MPKPPLPPFPLDNETLDLLEATMTTPGPDGSSSLFTTLDMLSGPPCEHEDCDYEQIGEDISYCGTPRYHIFGLVEALIAEVRHLRSQLEQFDGSAPGEAGQ